MSNVIVPTTREPISEDAAKTALIRLAPHDKEAYKYMRSSRTLGRYLTESGELSMIAAANYGATLQKLNDSLDKILAAMDECADTENESGIKQKSMLGQTAAALGRSIAGLLNVGVLITDQAKAAAGNAGYSRVGAPDLNAHFHIPVGANFNVNVRPTTEPPDIQALNKIHDSSSS